MNDSFAAETGKVVVPTRGVTPDALPPAKQQEEIVRSKDLGPMWHYTDLPGKHSIFLVPPLNLLIEGPLQTLALRPQAGDLVPERCVIKF